MQVHERTVSSHFSSCSTPTVTHALLQSLGQLGRVVRFLPDSHGIVVKVNGRRWTFHPLCLTPAPGQQIQDEESKNHLRTVTHRDG